MSEANSTQKQERPPVIAILGHIDHGKSTLLDYIRKTTITEQEAGGITQHLSAYEVTHTTADGSEKKLTFIDTPGHEAFAAQRVRGTTAADIAILIISAEDGVKKQTEEALATIQEREVPFVVAVSKIDRPNASVDKVLNDLTERGVYVEGRGGNISYVPVSAKTGEGVDDLLELLLLTAEIEGFTGDPTIPATGFIIEAHRDTKKGVTATLIIKDGTLSRGTYVATGRAYAPVRIMENFLGTNIDTASFSSPVRIVGWSDLPAIGTPFATFATKKEAEAYVVEQQTIQDTSERPTHTHDEDSETYIIPIILKTDVAGTLDALRHEINKIKKENVMLKVVRADAGTISERDAKAAGGDANTLVIGFGVSADTRAKEIAEREGITIKTFNIIYEMTEWLEQIVEERRPRISKEVEHGNLKVLKTFSQTKSRQVIGGKVRTGTLATGDTVKVMRRENQIGTGRIVELQTARAKTSEVSEGTECGLSVETDVTIAPGDTLVAFKTVEE